jgi:YVTN family beta-propeller protein
MALPTGAGAAFVLVGLLGLSAIAAGAIVPHNGTGLSAPRDVYATSGSPSATPTNQLVVGIEGSMDVGKRPTYMAEDLANGWMYVSNEGSATVTVLDGTHVEGNLSVGDGASGLVYDPESQFVYVADSSSNEVTVLDGTTNLATVPAGHGPCAPAYDAEDGWVYVPNEGSASVTILNGTTVVATIPVGADPVDATYDPMNGTVFITNEQSDFENILYGNATIALAPTYLINPFTTLYDPVNGFLYVTNITPNDGILSDVTVLNGSARLATFGVGPGPGYPAVNTSSGEVFVPSIGLDSVQVLNGTNLSGSVYVGGNPAAAAFDPDNGLIFVADDLTNDVSVLTPTRVVADVSVGQNPSWATYDSVNRYMYVAASGASQVFALGPVPGWAVNFSEKGLAKGIYWSATVKEVSAVSNSTSVIIYLPNGSYGYEIGAVVGYTPQPATGIFNVTGNAIDLLITFTQPPKPPGPGWLGLPNPIAGVLVGSAVAIVVGVTAWQLLSWRQRRRDRFLRA